MADLLSPVTADGQDCSALDSLNGSGISPKRFVISVTVALALVSIPYLWILWNMWGGSWSFLRAVEPANFYELQARALFAGHLWITHGALSIEGFNHDGHQYMYFGLFPTLIRMPILALTHRFDGKLTAPSLLIAWLVTGVFSSMLLWRLRVAVRGSMALNWSETISYAAIVATICGGSVLVDLAATPWVYNEDFAWSIALTVVSIFALVGVLEKPSLGRILWCGFAILLTNLNRQTTGYACVIGALMIGGWFLAGKGPKDSRKMAPLMLLAGLVPLAVNCTVNYLRFGMLFGLPMADQVWTQIDAHRRYFLASNGGSEIGIQFLPSTLLAYFQPFGIHVTTVFPFVTLPTTAARTVGGVVFDQTYPTASVPASDTLLFILTIWGIVVAFFWSSVFHIRGIAFVMLAAGSAAVGVLAWGYIANRYQGDILPVLIFGSLVGVVVLWHRMSGSGRVVHGLALGGVLLLAAWGIFANVAIAVSPTAQWTTSQTKRFVLTEKSLTPSALESTVEHGASLPAQSPSGHLFIAGDCSGLYLASGYNYSDTPGQQIENATWLPVEQSHGINQTIRFTVNGLLLSPLTLLKFSSAQLQLVPVGHEHAMLSVVNGGDPAVTWPTNNGPTFKLVHNGQYIVKVMTDPNLHAILVYWYGQKIIGRYLAGSGPGIIQVTNQIQDGHMTAISVANITPPGPKMSLCRSLLREMKGQ